MTADLIATALKMSVWLAVLINVAPVMSWIERRGCALIQDRPGPNRLGPFGLFQALADAVKFLFKETPMPSGADKLLYMMAPVLSIIPALTTYVVLPFGPDVEIGGRTVHLAAASGDTGVLLLLALASFGVYSLVLAGYSSNSKWSMMGSIRASAQMISYELALTLAVVATLIPSQSLRLDEVVAFQQGFWIPFVPKWNLFPQIIGFFVFLVAAFAETNRLPFDLSEAESELVAGYHTEYGGMRFALFMMGEYMSMAVLSALASTLYLGGWSLPGVDVPAIGAMIGGFLPAAIAPDVAVAVGTGLVGMGILVGKIFAFMLLFVWIRWTFPRFRYDQLMRLGWKLLLPLALLNLIVVAAMAIAGWI